MKKILAKLLTVILTVTVAVPMPFAVSPQPGIVHAEGSVVPPPQWTEIETVSTNVYGDQINGTMSASAITPDGRYVVFASSATNLDVRATTGDTHIYVRDRLTDQLELVDVNASGLAANASGERPSISDHGRYVVFQSEATNLVSETGGSGAGHFSRIYRVDRDTDTVELVSVSTVGVAADDASGQAEISGDGQSVVFQSSAGNLTAESVKSSDQIYLRDLENHITSMVSRDFAGDRSSEPSVSADGQVVAFITAHDGGSEWIYQIYRYDVATETSTLVTARTDASDGGEHGRPVVSADGSRMVFASSASNLVPGDTNGRQDIFLYDGDGGTLSRINVDDAGGESDADSFSPDLSPDGTRAAFESNARLVDGMPYESAGSAKTIYMYDIAAGQLTNVGGIEQARDGAEPSLASNAVAYTGDLSVSVAMNAGDMPVWPDHSLLSLVYMDDTNLQLSWDAASGLDIQLYKLYKTAFVNGIGMKTRLVGTITDTGMTVPSPTPGEMNHEVTYRIEAVNGLYHTSQSGPMMILGIDTDDMESPTWADGAEIHVDAVRSDSVTLSWPAADDNVGVQTYRIYMDVPVTPEQDFTPVFSTSDTTFVIPGLTPDTSYSFYVTAMDEAENESVPLPIIEVTTLPESELVVDGRLTAEEPLADGSVILNWSVDDRITSYEIWDVTDADQPVKLAETGYGSEQLTGLSASSTYQLQVIGYFGSAGGDANYVSNVVQVNTPPITIDRVTLSRDHITGGVAELGSAETVAVTGQPRRTASVRATYLTWYDTDGLTLLAVPRGASQDVPMEESSAHPARIPARLLSPKECSGLSNWRRI